MNLRICLSFLLLCLVMHFGAGAQVVQNGVGTLSNSTTQEVYIKDDSIVIGTGAITGVYYPLGSAICRIVNRAYDEHGSRCSAEITAGSLYNITALRNAEIDLAIVQSDWQHHAVNGGNIYKETGPFENMRSLFSFYTEALTFVVRNDSDIRVLDDIRGKNINIGNPGSGIRATIEELFAYKGWGQSSFQSLYQFKPFEQIEELCKGTIDVMILATGHPNGLVQEVTQMCEARLLNIADHDINNLVSNNADFSFATIPGGLYFGNTVDVKSFGVRATLVTTTDMSNEMAYSITKLIFDNLDDFRRLHPVFAHLDEHQMVNEGNIAPMHEGAKRYFTEKGLLTNK